MLKVECHFGDFYTMAVGKFRHRSHWTHFLENEEEMSHNDRAMAVRQDTRSNMFR